PAERYNLPTKGSIQVGKDADLIFIKPHSHYVLKEQDLEYRNKFSPYVGREIGAQVIQTLLRGKTIYQIDSGIDLTPRGTFIRR
ncbi:MAG: amidohydrolase family protein, partial [Gilliamella apicola]|nr:amidohydrolase family protein [Gilliamella apicola]